MKKAFDVYIEKARYFLRGKKLAREIMEEFFNHGIGYIAGLVAYNYLSRFFEVRSAKNLWGIVNFRKKVLIDKDTFEGLEFIISAVVGFIIFKVASHYSSKLWDRYEEREKRKSYNNRKSQEAIKELGSEADLFIKKHS